MFGKVVKVKSNQIFLATFKDEEEMRRADTAFIKINSNNSNNVIHNNYY